MAASTAILTLAAIAGALLIAALVWVARNQRNEHRHVEAENIRGQARGETFQVRQREALADETAAKARAVQVEADVKAAQALGVQPRAAAHRAASTVDQALTGASPERVWFRFFADER